MHMRPKTLCVWCWPSWMVETSNFTSTTWARRASTKTESSFMLLKSAVDWSICTRNVLSTGEHRICYAVVKIVKMVLRFSWPVYEVILLSDKLLNTLICVIYHRDLKPENILLDDNGEFWKLRFLITAIFISLPMCNFILQWHRCTFSNLNVSCSPLLCCRTHPYFWPGPGHQSAWRRAHQRQGGNCGLHG